MCDSVINYKIYTSEGKFKEFGAYPNNQISLETTYMDRSSIFRAVLYDSSELLINKE